MATLFTVFYFKFSRNINSVVIEEMGDRFTVSVYQLPIPMKIPVLYKPGDLAKELKTYPWLKAYLFIQRGIEEYIPREEWCEYAAYEWDEKLYADTAKNCEAMKKAFLGKDKVYYSGVRSEMTEVVMCETEKTRALVFCTKSVSADGNSRSSRYAKLVDFQGKWKRTADKDQGRYLTQLMNCYEKAMKLVAEEKLKTNPIRIEVKDARVRPASPRTARYTG